MAYGKKVGKYVYLHRSVAMHCAFFDELKDSVLNTGRYISWNVLKLDCNIPGSFSLLRYRSFKLNLFPELIGSVTFRNWHFSSKRCYLKSNNPKILHRKELLVSKQNEQYLNWAHITEILEQIGAFEQPKFIGSKGEWLKILEAKKEKFNGTSLETYLVNNRIATN